MSIPVATFRGCETGLSWGKLLLSRQVSPALGRMFMARPSGGPWRFWVLGSAGSSISRGKSAPRQPATLPNGLASLQEANYATGRIVATKV
jgi:hypothetical protein